MELVYIQYMFEAESPGNWQSTRVCVVLFATAWFGYSQQFFLLLPDSNLSVACLNGRPGYIGVISEYLDVADATNFAAQKARQVRPAPGPIAMYSPPTLFLLLDGQVVGQPA